MALSLDGTTGISCTGNIVSNGGIISATGNIYGGNIIGTIAPSAITVTGNANVGNLFSSGVVSSTGNVTGGNILTGGLISATGNITGGNLNVTGNIVDTGELWINTGSNGNININPNGTGTTNIPVGVLSVTGNIQGGNLRTAGLISATGAITGAAITGTSLTVSTGNVTLGNLVNSGANATGNIGSATTYFNTVFAKATSALYADLAENYEADANYEPGTVLEFGGDKEVTQTTSSHRTQVAGIVSTNPSYLMNSGISGDKVVAVALTGRVPCYVIGNIVKGDRLVSSNTLGVATVLDITQYQPGCIIGKALENYNSQEIGIIEVAVGRF